MSALAVRAPGRVNLIGEHTDYNDGWVLPMAIDREIRVTYDRRAGSRVELTSGGDRIAFDLADAAAGVTEIPRSGTWADHAVGMAWSLAAAGLAPRGLRGTLESDLPPGSGLSSSAALQLAIGWALLDEPQQVDPMILARCAQRAENEIVGVRSGIMDQAAIALARGGHALLLDCRSLDARHVAIPPGAAIVAIDSGASRALAATAYNQRRAECEAAVALLAARDPAVRSLRDVDPSMLADAASALPPTLLRRARHVVSENERVQRVVAAFEAGDLVAAGAALNASHDSLRDDYEVSSPALDALVAIARSVPGVHGTRLTGAGFGGCTVSLVEPDAVAALGSAVAKRYAARTGLVARVMLVEAANGVGWA